MHHITVEKSIPHSADTVWKLVDDFPGVHAYHPAIGASDSLNGQTCGLGAERSCTFYNGDVIKERVVAHSDAEKMYTVLITDPGPFPLNHMQLVLKVVPNGKHSTVVLDAEFEPKFGPVGWVMGAVMMKPQFKRTLLKLIDGIDTHLTTGRIVGKGGKVGELLQQAA